MLRDGGIPVERLRSHLFLFANKDKVYHGVRALFATRQINCSVSDYRHVSQVRSIGGGWRGTGLMPGGGRVMDGFWSTVV